MENYLQSFQWNKVKYRADKPIFELIDTLQKEIASVDNDVKAKFNQYNSSKTSLASLQRSHTGNLSQKSLATIINPDSLLKPHESEYLMQHLVAVPSQIAKDFLKTYETVAPMVVPRSAQLLAKDDEYQLYVITVFKKYSTEFVHKCREHRWTPRELKFTDGGREAEEQQLRKLEKDERRVWGEALRLGRAGYSDAVMAWIHVLVLRVFVETVLRYGLPLAYVCGLIKVNPPPHCRKGSHFVLRNDMLMLFGLHRRTRNGLRKRRAHWMLASLIWEETRLARTKRVGPSKTTLVCSRTWQVLGLAKPVMNHTSSISSKLSRQRLSGTILKSRLSTGSTPTVQRSGNRSFVLLQTE